MNNNKVKIVHIAQSNGGVEIYLKMFLKYMDKNKYDNYLILSEQYNEAKIYFEELEAKVFIIKMEREINIYKDIKAFINIYSILKEIKPDIVYTHSSKAGALGRIPAKLIRAKNVYNPHGWSFDMNVSKKKRFIFKCIEKTLGIFTDHIIAISKYERDIAISSKIVSEKKVTIIENAIDLQNFDRKYDSKDIFTELQCNEEYIIIGMIARISDQKSPHTFIDIAKILSKKYKKIKFLMVGDGDLREEIEERIEIEGLKSKVYITGWTKNPYRYLSVFDIAILTSKWEGFGLVVPEYMVAKKPVVASNVGGISNIIIDKKNGFLINDLNVLEFCDKIEYILENNSIKQNIIDEAYNIAIIKYDFKRNIKEHDFVFNNKL